MSTILHAKSLKLTDHVRILKLFFFWTNGAASIIYAFLRLSLPQAQFTMLFEMILFLKVILISSVSALGLYRIFPLSVLVEHISRKLSKIQFSGSSLLRIILIIAIGLSTSSCQAQTLKRVKKDLNTGLRTTYENLVPGETEMVMNGEVIGHTDIPLGEEFIIVNKGVRGLVTKAGKVSVGCSLVITDKKNNVLLKDPDLFKNINGINVEKAKYLKCIVSTGKPMEWEEKYNVHVVFWDKWGQGKIVNDVSIRTIDIP